MIKYIVILLMLSGCMDQEVLDEENRIRIERLGNRIERLGDRMDELEGRHILQDAREAGYGKLCHEYVEVVGGYGPWLSLKAHNYPRAVAYCSYRLGDINQESISISLESLDIFKKAQKNCTTSCKEN